MKPGRNQWTHASRIPQGIEERVKPGNEHFKRGGGRAGQLLENTQNLCRKLLSKNDRIWPIDIKRRFPNRKRSPRNFLERNLKSQPQRISTTTKKVENSNKRSTWLHRRLRGPENKKERAHIGSGIFVAKLQRKSTHRYS